MGTEVLLLCNTRQCHGCCRSASNSSNAKNWSRIGGSTGRSWPSWGGWDGGIDSADNIHGTHNAYAVCLVCKCLPCSRSRSTEPKKRMVSRFYSVWSLGWSKLMTSFHFSAYQRQLLPGTRVSLDCWAHSVWRLRIELVHVLGCCLLCFLHFQGDVGQDVESTALEALQIASVADQFWRHSMASSIVDTVHVY